MHIWKIKSWQKLGLSSICIIEQVESCKENKLEEEWELEKTKFVIMFCGDFERV